MAKPIQALHALGQSLWYDNIRRGLLRNGGLAKMIADGEIRGVTSNPSIFQKAIGDSQDYEDDLREMAGVGRSSQEVYESLAIADIQEAADLFFPLYQESKGGDGYVSLEVNPHLAQDTEGTIAEAKRLWRRVDRPNLMVKIPATEAGLPAITETIAEGVNVNVTLIFSLSRYEKVINAYLEGLERRVAAGEAIGHIASVASFFISRVDSKVDQKLAQIIHGEGRHASTAMGLLGKLAVANAKLAYQIFQQYLLEDRHKILSKSGANYQRPLWASTSTKNPDYSDVKYVNELIGPSTVNTLPPVTLDAFRDHGVAEITIDQDVEQAHEVLHSLEKTGISMQHVTGELEVEGVKAFADAFDVLLETIHQRLNLR
jgi:transaldolase